MRLVEEGQPWKTRIGVLGRPTPVGQEFEQRTAVCTAESITVFAAEHTRGMQAGRPLHRNFEILVPESAQQAEHIVRTLAVTEVGLVVAVDLAVPVEVFKERVAWTG